MARRNGGAKLLPLDLFGLDAASLLDLLSNAPAKVAAFVRTLLEISRTHGMRVEQFFFSALRTFQEVHDNHFDDLEAEAAALTRQVAGFDVEDSDF